MTKKKKPPREHDVGNVHLREIESLDEELARFAAAKKPPRWNANPEDVQRSVARLVLALVELLRRLMERQAIRRMEANTMSPEEVERVGLALMKLEETVRDLCSKFGIDPEELNIDLGPLGKLF
jgi:hypothetical protein